MEGTTATELKGKFVALFFYSSNSSLARELAGTLRKTYLQLAAQGEPFEVVLVCTEPTDKANYLEVMSP